MSEELNEKKFFEILKECKVPEEHHNDWLKMAKENQNKGHFGLEVGEEALRTTAKLLVEKGRCAGPPW